MGWDFVVFVGIIVGCIMLPVSLTQCYQNQNKKEVMIECVKKNKPDECRKLVEDLK